MIPRELEPEVMDSAEEALDYNAMDHSEVNRRFAEDFLAVWRSCRPHSAHEATIYLLDVGTGTALIPLEIIRLGFSGRIVAVDLAQSMLEVAHRNVQQAGLLDRIVLEKADAKQLPYDNDTFDAVISNSIVHHVAKPDGVFQEMVRVLKPGGCLFVRDLLRPDSYERVEELVQTYCGQENEHQQQMFRDSLKASLTLEELKDVLQRLKLTGLAVEQTSDRHWTVSGVPKQKKSMA